MRRSYKEFSLNTRDMGARYRDDSVAPMSIRAQETDPDDGMRRNQICTTKLARGLHNAVSR